MNESDPVPLNKHLISLLEKARVGNCLAAAEAAVIVHCQDDVSKTPYDASIIHDLLGVIEKSENAELLICVGEELFLGKFLPKNNNRAIRFYALANEISSYMGAFMLGRIPGLTSRSDYLDKAIRAGHVPSLFFRDLYRLRDLHLMHWSYRQILRVLWAIRICLALADKENISIRFWRYKDVNLDTLKFIGDDFLSTDRKDYLREIKDRVCRERG